jgi:hypothetical protein
MNILLRLSLCIAVAFGLAAESAHAYVYAFSRFYNRKLKTTVDILYDEHINPKDPITNEDWGFANDDRIKRKLFPTERHLLYIFEQLNKYSKAKSVDLIFENNFRTVSVFISSSYLLTTKLTNLNYIHSDTWRDALFSLFKCYNFQHYSRPCSVNNPAPLPECRKVQIIRNSPTICDKYLNLRRRTITQLENEFLPVLRRERSLDSEKDLILAPACIAIADLEILSHILASTKKRIIVYAGGAHCENIRDFLLQTHEYIEVRYQNNNYEPPHKDVRPFVSRESFDRYMIEGSSCGSSTELQPAQLNYLLAAHEPERKQLS